MTIFIRAIEEPIASKAAFVRRVVNGGSDKYFDVDHNVFSAIPGSPFAYWVSPGIIDVFQRVPLMGSERTVVSTNPLNLDERYVRLWWEVSSDKLNDRWMPWAKGGEFAKIYCDIYTVISWQISRQTYNGFLGTDNRPLSRPASVQHFFRPGITWPRRTDGLSFRVLPAGSIFADKGPAAFVASNRPSEILATCAIMNSRIFGYLVGVQLARTELAQSYEVGLIQQTPFPTLSESDVQILAKIGKRIWSNRYQINKTKEISHAFECPVVQSNAISCITGEEQIDECDLFKDIDSLAYSLYEIDAKDREVVDAIYDREPSAGPSEDEAERGSQGVFFEGEAILNWTVGIAFGRFDIRLATGERAIPSEPEPFDPLPAKSPGMLPDGDAPFLASSGIFVDDVGHPNDLAARAAAVYERVGEAPPENLRRSLGRDFFPAHIRMYSKSRRKAPIYWQLATPSARYSVWLYIHAFGKDTLFRVQNDYVAPKLAHERRELEGLLAEAGPSPTAAQSRAVEAQSTFVEELSDLLDEVKRVAPLWDPDLDDGVILNFAPLWRLVPQNRPWQKELRAAWAALVAGDYDWAHLSVRLWPERVVPKCAKDRSLAIAHDLEDVFWFEDAAGKWQARPTPTRPLDELIAERTSPAVKAALQSLLDAPDLVAATGRGRRKKS